MYPKFEELKLSGDLPSPSGVGMQVLNLTRDAEFCMDELLTVIRADPALTGKLLKIANSARAAGVDGISNVEQAAMRLGASTVRNVALGFSLMTGSRTGICPEFDYDGNWSESIGRAMLAEAIADEHGLCSSSAFITGLLSLIGRLGLASTHADSYGRVLREVSGAPMDVRLDREKSAFEIDHIEVATALVDEWALPDEVPTAITEHLQQREVEGPINSLASVLWAAAALASFVFQPANRRFHAVPDIDALMQRAGLKLDGLRKLLAAVMPKWTQMAEALSIPQPDDLDLPIAWQEAMRRHADWVETGPKEVGEGGAVGESDKKRPDPENEGKGVTVLAVDDDAVSLRILVRELEKRGFSVVTARDGEEGLRVAMTAAPQIVVSDWQMPKMDGLELVRALRRWGAEEQQGRGQDLYVIMLTGNEKDEQLIEAFEAGADDYVVKPLKPRVLAARLHAGLRVIRLQKSVNESQRQLARAATKTSADARRFEKNSLTDPLTGLDNRRAAEKHLEALWQRARTAGDSFCVIMCDIDHFKSVNDNFGHDVGDVVLKETATLMNGLLRAGERVCRMGGEEFLIIIEKSDSEAARRAAERVRAAVERNIITAAGDFKKAVTISMGVAEDDGQARSVDELVKVADLAVYEAKNAGRNRVIVNDGRPART